MLTKRAVRTILFTLSLILSLFQNTYAGTFTLNVWFAEVKVPLTVTPTHTVGMVKEALGKKLLRMRAVQQQITQRHIFRYTDSHGKWHTANDNDASLAHLGVRAGTSVEINSRDALKTLNQQKKPSDQKAAQPTHSTPRSSTPAPIPIILLPSLVKGPLESVPEDGEESARDFSHAKSTDRSSPPSSASSDTHRSSSSGSSNSEFSEEKVDVGGFTLDAITVEDEEGKTSSVAAKLAKQHKERESVTPRQPQRKLPAKAENEHQIKLLLDAVVKDLNSNVLTLADNDSTLEERFWGLVSVSSLLYEVGMRKEMKEPITSDEEKMHKDLTQFVGTELEKWQKKVGENPALLLTFQKDFCGMRGNRCYENWYALYNHHKQKDDKIAAARLVSHGINLVAHFLFPSTASSTQYTLGSEFKLLRTNVNHFLVNVQKIPFDQCGIDPELKTRLLLGVEPSALVEEPRSTQSPQTGMGLGSVATIAIATVVGVGVAALAASKYRMPPINRKKFDHDVRALLLFDELEENCAMIARDKKEIEPSFCQRARDRILSRYTERDQAMILDEVERIKRTLLDSKEIVWR